MVNTAYANLSEARSIQSASSILRSERQVENESEARKKRLKPSRTIL